MPKEDEVYTESEVELKSGEEARLLVPFHSNPHPTNLSWVITDVGTLDESIKNIGRFHHEGWNKTVCILYFHTSYIRRHYAKHKDFCRMEHFMRDQDPGASHLSTNTWLC